MHFAKEHFTIVHSYEVHGGFYPFRIINPIRDCYIMLWLIYSNPVHSAQRQQWCDVYIFSVCVCFMCVSANAPFIWDCALGYSNKALAHTILDLGTFGDGERMATNKTENHVTKCGIS